MWFNAEHWARLRAVTGEHDDVELTKAETITFWSIAQNAEDGEW